MGRPGGKPSPPKLRLLVGALHLVSSRVFRTIKGAIGACEHRLRRIVIATTVRHTDTDRDGNGIRIDAVTGRFDQRANSFGSAAGGFRFGFNQYDDELFAAESRGVVDVPDRLRKNGSHSLQHRIAGEMTVAVIDRLEVVDVQHQHGKGPVQAPETGELVEQNLVENFWLQGVTAGHKNTYDCIAAFSATDFTRDLARFDRPTLVVHGDDDQVVPIDASARAVKRLLPSAQLVIYAGGPHGITDTHKERLNDDLLTFLRS